jgi:ankyrin repeat protein
MRRRHYFNLVCAKGKWDDVLRHLEISRHLDKISKTGSTILHQVCCFQPPRKVVERIVALYPKLIMVVDICGRLPLHEACRYKASLEVIEFMVDAYSRAAYIQDRQGKTPLHYASDVGFAHDYLLLDVILSLSARCPHTLTFQDSRGMTPVDIILTSFGHRSSSFINHLLEIIAVGGEPPIFGDFQHKRNASYV